MSRMILAVSVLMLSTALTPMAAPAQAIPPGTAPFSLDLGLASSLIADPNVQTNDLEGTVKDGASHSSLTPAAVRSPARGAPADGSLVVVRGPASAHQALFLRAAPLALTAIGVWLGFMSSGSSPSTPASASKLEPSFADFPRQDPRGGEPSDDGLGNGNGNGDGGEEHQGDGDVESGGDGEVESGGDGDDGISFLPEPPPVALFLVGLTALVATRARRVRFIG